MISSILGFISIPLLGWLSDKVGRRLPYILLNISAIILAYPMLSIIVDKSYAPGVIMLSIIVIHNFAVLGLFAPKTSRWRRCLARVTALPGWLSQKRRAGWWR